MATSVDAHLASETRTFSIIKPSEKHVGTVIMCHGMGDNGDSWKNAFLQWSWDTRFPHLKFLFPNAQEIAITLAKGYTMSAWYDILTTNDVRGGLYDEKGLANCRDYLVNLIEEEMQIGIEAENILLGGFSQGGAIGLYTGLTMDQDIGGVFALSAYLPMAPQAREISHRFHFDCNSPSLRTQFVLMNGTNDPVVKHPWAKWSVEGFENSGCDVQLMSYR